MEEPFTDSKTLKEAKDTILILSESDYPYAQYLQGFMALQDNKLHALHWFKKSHKNNFMRKECAILIGLLYIYLEDFPRATPYLNEAVYDYHIESLKPELMTAYTQQDKKDTALKLAREIAEDYTKFPLDNSLTSMAYLSLALFEGEVIERNLKESYTWLERAHHIAKANSAQLNLTSNHLPALKTQTLPKGTTGSQKKSAVFVRTGKTVFQNGRNSPMLPNLSLSFRCLKRLSEGEKVNFYTDLGLFSVF